MKYDLKSIYVKNMSELMDIKRLTDRVEETLNHANSYVILSENLEAKAYLDINYTGVIMKIQEELNSRKIVYEFSWNKKDIATHRFWDADNDTQMDVKREKTLKERLYDCGQIYQADVIQDIAKGIAMIMDELEKE